MYSQRFNTIFVHIPKTGGQSIEHVFMAEHGLSWEARSPLLLRKRARGEQGPPRLAHLFAREYVSLGHVPAEDFAACLKFAVVRNPHERALSAYRYRRANVAGGESESYRDFVMSLGGQTEHRQTVGQADYVLDESGKFLVDDVLRFETLAADFAKISLRIFGRAIDLPHVNKSVAAIPTAAGDPSLRREIHRRYERDFDLFRYPSGL